MPNAVIAAIARTPIGKAFKGTLVDTRGDDLGGFAIRRVLEQLPQLDPAEITDLYWGCAVPYHTQGYNVARQIGLLGGLPESVPAATMVRACGSSLSTIRAAVHAIEAGDGDVYLAGGGDSDSMCMNLGFNDEDRNLRFVDRSRADFINLAYMDVFTTAERVADLHGVTREQMDEFAVRSQARAASALESGFFASEVTPYTTESGEVLETDESIRPGTTVEVLAGLRAIVPEAGGRVTAGNTTVAGDGAAVAVVMSEDRAERLGVRPRARILATSVSGLAPELMGLGPIESMRKAMKRTKLGIEDFDIVECHENFAAQVLPVCDALGIDTHEQLNPFGGALALGHPSGMSGTRMLATLLNGLDHRGGRYGAATTCAAGGQGATVIVERLA